MHWRESKPAYRECLDFEFADSPLLPRTDNAACGWLLFEDLSKQDLAEVFREMARVFERAADRVEDIKEKSGDADEEV